MEIKLDTKNTKATLTIQIAPEDYKADFHANLKAYAAKISMKGFRNNGSLRLALIQKRHGKQILEETILHCASKAALEQIEKHKLTLLRDMELDASQQNQQDWVPGTSFVLLYNMDIIPDADFEPEIDDSIEVKAYEIVSVGDKTLQQYIDTLRRIHGTTKERNPEHTIVEHDIVDGDILDSTGAKKDIHLLMTKENLHITNLQGKKIGDECLWPAKTVAKLHHDILQDWQEKIADSTSDFRFIIHKITEVVPAKLELPFFDCVLGKGNVTTTQAFKKEIQTFYLHKQQEIMDHWVRIQIRQQLVAKYPITLSKEYEDRREQITWNLLTNKIAQKHQIEATEEEVLQNLAAFYYAIFLHLGEANPHEKVSERLQGVLEDPQKTAYKHTEQEIIEEKVLELIQKKITKHHQKISAEEMDYYLESK